MSWIPYLLPAAAQAAAGYVSTVQVGYTIRQIFSDLWLLLTRNPSNVTVIIGVIVLVTLLWVRYSRS